MPLNLRASITKRVDSILKSYSGRLWFRATLLLFAFILLVLIFSPNGVRLKEELKLGANGNPQSGQVWNHSDTASLASTEKLIEKEHEKANVEIKMLQEQIDTWYHYKFLLIGGIVALFLGQFGILGKQSASSPKTSERILVATLMSNRASIMLALICFVALVIDMHIRACLTNMQGLGWWIYSYVEPSYFRSIGAQTGNIPQAGLVETQFMPWETFLHTNIRQIQQTNPLYRTAYSLQLHFMTIAIYILYLVVFQNICLLCKKGKQQQVAFLGFVLVHIAIAAFIIVAHTVPNSFDVKCFPISYFECWETGSQGSSYYLIAWLVLMLFSLPYLCLLLPSFQGNDRPDRFRTPTPA